MSPIAASTLTPEELLAGLDPHLPLPLAMVKTGLDELADLAPADLDPAASLELARELLVAADRARALALRSVADVDRRDLWALDGAPSTGTWVADQPSSMPRSEVSLASQLDRVPQVAAAIAAGELSIDSGVLVGKALTKLRPHVDQPDGRIDGQDGEQALTGVIVDGVTLLAGAILGGLADDDPRVVALRGRLVEIAAAPLPQLVRLEAAFLQLACWTSGRLLRDGLAELVDALLPNELAERSEDAHDNRGITLVRKPGGSGWRLSGDLDDECGEHLHTVLTAAMATDPENKHDTEIAAELREDGIDPYDPDLLADKHRPRSVAGRRHDALQLILRKVIDAGVLGARGKQPVRIGVTISLDALRDRPGALPARGDSGQTLPAGLVRQWLCDSAISRYVVGLAGRVLEASHTGRTLKPHERRVKQLETRGLCQTAHCTRGDPSGHPLIPHHPDAYARSGITSLADTVLLCEPHHTDLHVGGKTLRLEDSRRLDEHGWLDS